MAEGTEAGEGKKNPTVTFGDGPSQSRLAPCQLSRRESQEGRAKEGEPRAFAAAYETERTDAGTLR